MKLNLTEQDLFGIIVDCISRNFPSLCRRIEFLYEVKLSDVEKNVLHPVVSCIKRGSLVNKL